MKFLAFLLIFLTHGVFASIDTIWFNAKILTMSDFSPKAEAVAVSNGRIVEIGKNENILKMREFQTKLIDLGGKTLLPGFIDSYGNLTVTAIKKIGGDLSPPPEGNTSSIKELTKNLSAFLKNSPYPEDYGVLIGFGYDESQLIENRHPNRSELDRVSAKVPILVIHQSGDFGVMNTKAMSLIGLTNLKGKSHNGLLEGAQLSENLMKLFSNLSDRQLIDIILKGEEEYLQQGFTTIQDEGISKEQIDILIKASKEKKLTLDVISYIDYLKPDLNSFMDYPYYENTNSNPMYTFHYRIGGYKIRLDGSLQSKTAWLSKPYMNRPLNESKGYLGYQKISDNELEEIYKDCLKNFKQILTVANGDRAIEQMIRTYRRAKKKHPSSKIRPILIHGHTLTQKQIKELKNLEIEISLLPEFILHWGDWNISNILGKERSESLSPAGWLREEIMTFSFHNGSPEMKASAIDILSTAVERKTRRGKNLGEELKVTPYVALKAITEWAAYQYFEEKTKGTLEKGKIADFVILSKNPLKVEEDKIKKIKILETIKEGESVYRHPSFKIKNRSYKSN